MGLPRTPQGPIPSNAFEPLNGPETASNVGLDGSLPSLFILAEPLRKTRSAPLAPRPECLVIRLPLCGIFFVLTTRIWICISTLKLNNRTGGDLATR